MSEASYRLHEGSSPLVVSVPHDGRVLPGDIARRMTPVGRSCPDTDWHVARLYDFAVDLGASVIVARPTRYVVDLNRPPDDEALYEDRIATGICPERTFGGEAIYAPGAEPSAAERERRISTWWRPYHDALARTLCRVEERHGHVLLWDAHSIVSRVPALFDGELPVLNVGTFGGRSAAPALERAVWAVADAAPLPAVLNGRFTGGYITRHYGRPAERVHAVQLELAQRGYMDERRLRYDERRAARVRAILCDMLRAYTAAGAALYAGRGAHGRARDSGEPS